MHLFKTSSFIYFTLLMVEGATIARLDPEEVPSRDKRDMFLDLGRDAVGTGWRVLRGIAGGVGGGLSDTFTGNADDVRFGSFGSWGGRAVGATGGLLAGHHSVDFKYGSSWAAGDGSNIFSGPSSQFLSSMSAFYNSNENSKIQSNTNYPTGLFNLNQEGFGARKFGFRDSAIGALLNVGSRNVISPLEHVGTTSNVFFSGEHLFNVAGNGHADNVLGRVENLFGKPTLPDKLNTKEVIFGSALEHAADDASTLIIRGDHEVLAPGILVVQAGQADGFENIFDGKHLFGERVKLPDKHNIEDQIFESGSDHVVDDASTLIVEGGHGVSTPEKAVALTGQTVGSKNLSEKKHLDSEKLKLPDKHITDEHVIESGLNHEADDATASALEIADGGYGVSAPEIVVAQMDGADDLSDGKHLNSENIKLTDKRITDEHVIESGLEHEADNATASTFEIANGGYGISAPEKVVAQMDGSDDLSDGKHLNSENIKLPDKRITDEHVIESGLEHEADDATASAFEIANGGYGVSAPEKVVAQTDGSDNLSDGKHLNSENLKLPDKRITDEQVIESGLEHEADDATASAFEIADGGYGVSTPEKVVAQTGQTDGSENLSDGKHLNSEKLKLPDKRITDEQVIESGLEHEADGATASALEIADGGYGVSAPEKVVAQMDGSDNLSNGKHLNSENIKLPDQRITDEHVIESGLEHEADNATASTFEIANGGYGISAPEKVVAQMDGSDDLSDGKHLNSENIKLPDKRITDEHVIESGLEHEADDATASAFEIANGGYGVSAPEKVVAQTDGSDNLSDGKHLNSENLKLPDKHITDEQVIESGLEHEADDATASAFEIADGGYGVSTPEKVVAQTGQTDGSENLSDGKHLNSEKLKLPDKRITDEQVIESGLEHEADGATASALEIADGGQGVSAPENVVAQIGQAVDSEKIFFDVGQIFGETGGVASTSGNMVTPENLGADDNAFAQAVPNVISSGSSLVDREHLFGQNQQVVGFPKKNIADDEILSSASGGYKVDAPGSEHGSSSVAGGSSKIDAGQALKVLSSKNTTSSSNKSSKIKSSISFGGSSSNLNLNGYGTSQLNKLVYDSSGFHFGGNIGNNGLQHVYGQRNVGVNVVDQSNSEASILDGNMLQFSGSISTDVEESESNSQSNSKSYNASNVSQYGALDRIFAYQNVGIDSSKVYIAF